MDETRRQVSPRASANEERGNRTAKEMAIVCEGCGGYVEPTVEKEAERVRCPECGRETPMRILPLFIVTGASATGKTAVVAELRRLMPDWDVFETDVIWGADWQQVRSNWLRVAHSIAQSGRGTILCGTMLPADVDRCDHRSFFRQLYYLILHCDDAIRAARLRDRPAWRGCTEAFIAEQQCFARWLLQNAATAFDPPAPVLHTGHTPMPLVAGRIRDWVQEQWRREMDGVSPAKAPREKVLAYITRRRGTEIELLAFQPREIDEGLQLPAGGVEQGEELVAALWREIAEESGLTELTLHGRLVSQLVVGARRHYFHLEAPPDLPDTWSYVVTAGGEDAGMTFDFRWLPLPEAASSLIHGFGDWVHLLTK